MLSEGFHKIDASRIRHRVYHTATRSRIQRSACAEHPRDLRRSLNHLSVEGCVFLLYKHHARGRDHHSRNCKRSVLRRSTCGHLNWLIPNPHRVLPPTKYNCGCCGSASAGRICTPLRAPNPSSTTRASWVMNWRSKWLKSARPLFNKISLSGITAVCVLISIVVSVMPAAGVITPVPARLQVLRVSIVTAGCANSSTFRSTKSTKAPILRDDELRAGGNVEHRRTCGLSAPTSTPGETVVVVGVSPIGLGVAQFAHLAGAHVIALDVSDPRTCLRPSANRH